MNKLITLCLLITLHSFNPLLIAEPFDTQQAHKLQLIFSELNADNLNLKSKKESTKKLSIDQSIIIDKLICYLKLHNKDTKIIDRDGMCNGFSFLVQYYAELNQKDDYFKLLESISAWDEKASSLQKTLTVFGNQSSFDHILEQFIDDLVWYQANKFDSFQNFNVLSQKKRTQQFQIHKNFNDERDIAMLLSPIEFFGVSLKELEEIIGLWTFYPNTILEFGGKNHATSARILQNGKIFYYDPNEMKRMKIFDSVPELVKAIEKTKYRKLGHSHINIDIMAYQYVPKGQKPYIPSSVGEILLNFNEKKSQNKFTLYHMAIFANDISLLRSLVEQSKGDPNKASTETGKRVIGVTPLLLAVLMERSEFVEELLKHSKIDINKCSANAFTPIMGAIGHCNLEATELLLNYGINLFKTSDQLDELSDILNDRGSGNTLSILSIPAVNLAQMKTAIECEFIRELCRRVPDLLELHDSEGKTLIDYAIFFGNQLLVDLLSEEMSLVY